MNYVWSPDPTTEFVTSLLVLALMWLILPAIFWLYITREKKLGAEKE